MIEEKKKLEDQVQQLAKQASVNREDGNLWMDMYFRVQKDYLEAVEKAYGKKEEKIVPEYFVSPEGWILPKNLIMCDNK